MAEYSEALNERLADKVSANLIPVYMTGRSEIVEYFKGEYGDGWKSHLAKRYSDASNGEVSYKSAMRQFQMDKRTGQERYKSGKQTAATRARYEALGKQLPPARLRAPRNGFKVNFRGRVKISGGRKQYSKKTGKYDGKMRGDGWVKADFTTVIPGGSEAIQFGQEPNWNEVFAPYFNNFDENPVQAFEIASLTITAED